MAGVGRSERDDAADQRGQAAEIYGGSHEEWSGERASPQGQEGLLHAGRPRPPLPHLLDPFLRLHAGKNDPTWAAGPSVAPVPSRNPNPRRCFKTESIHKSIWKRK